MKNQEKLTWDEVKAMYAETDRMFKETDKKFDRLEKMIDKDRELIGGISRSNGEFCEEYFINTLKENPTLLGEKYEHVINYLKPSPPIVINDEYDLVMFNGTTIALIEIKYKTDTNDLRRLLSKLRSFRANFPKYENYKIYLCLASFRFPQNVRSRAAEEGVVLLQQRGDVIEVVSENVTTW